MTEYGRCLRPALAPLRGSARFAVFGLAAIAIAGCVKPEPVCIGGVTYIQNGQRAAVTVAVDREGRPVPCEGSADG